MSKLHDFFCSIGGDFERTYAGAAAQGRSLGIQQQQCSRSSTVHSKHSRIRDSRAQCSTFNTGETSRLSHDLTDVAEVLSPRKTKPRAKIFLNRNIRRFFLGVSPQKGGVAEQPGLHDEDPPPQKKRPRSKVPDANIYFHFLYNNNDDAKLAGRVRNRSFSAHPNASSVQASRWAVCPLCGFRAFSNRQHGMLRLSLDPGPDTRQQQQGWEGESDGGATERWTTSTSITVATLVAHMVTSHPTLRCDFVQCSISLSLHVVVQPLPSSSIARVAALDSSGAGGRDEPESTGLRVTQCIFQGSNAEWVSSYALCDASYYQTLEAPNRQGMSAFLRNKCSDWASLDTPCRLKHILASVGVKWPPTCLPIAMQGGSRINAGFSEAVPLRRAAIHASSPLLRRRFFHRSGIPYASPPSSSTSSTEGGDDSMILNYDSENEEFDITTGIIEDAQLTEFNDVALEEKAFMSLWNAHVRKFPVYSQCYLPYVCEVFARRYGSFIAKNRLRMSFLVLLLHLWSACLLRAEEAAAALAIVDREMARLKQQSAPNRE